jgi:uncharacterized delta-60 repeat protein
MVVTSFSPDRGLPGITTIRIQGSGFYRVTSVKFGGVAANILLPPYSDTDMVVTVPDGAHTGPITLSDGTNTIATDTFSVIRPAGELDRDFGTSGVTTIDADPARTEQLTAMTVDGDGRIVAAGRFTSGNPPYPSDTGPILVRLNADGTPDTSFGTSGVVVANLASAPYFKARSVTAMADGKILVGGTVDWNGTDGGDRLGVIRFLADGSVDTSFGTDGVAIKKVFVNGGNCGLGTVVMTVTPDGRIAMLGDPCHDAALVVFLADGTLDPSFGDGGVAVLPTTYDTGPRVVLAQPDGKLVAAGPLSGVTAGGSPWHAIVIARVDAEGSLDPSFGTNGLATHTSHGVQLPYFGAVLPDGHIVLAGAADGPFGFEAVRLDTNGTPDPSFGTAGWGFIGPQDNVFSHAAAVEPDGRVDVAGGRFVGRFTPDGFPDTTFGTNGVAPRGPAAWSVGALQPGSGFVVGGAVNADKSLIARYTTEPPVVP